MKNSVIIAQKKTHVLKKEQICFVVVSKNSVNQSKMKDDKLKNRRNEER